MPLIYREKKCVLFRLKNPKRITEVIATAKLVQHQGDVLVAVPHRPDETRVLRNLGFEVPDPMPIYYDWPGPHKPFDVQLKTATFMSLHNRLFCLNEMGTGKTTTALWAYDYLRSVKAVKRVLIVAPLSTLERTWADTVFKTFPHLSYSVLYGTAQRRKKLLAQKADVYIINIDGLRTISLELKDRDDIDLLIVDEVAMARNQGTDRWKVLNEIANKQKPRRVWGMTGAPIPNAPTDAWAQCRLVNPVNPDVPRYFSAFRDKVMRQQSQYVWVPREDALEYVQRAMQPSIRFSLDECVDLPEQMIEYRDVELTKEQQTAYADMVKKLTAEYAGGQITAVNEAVKANKLVQIACGVAYDAAGNHVMLPVKPRIDELIDIIEASSGKVLIFAPLTGVIEHISDQLSQKWEVGVVTGDTSKDDRDRIFGRFQQSHDPLRVIVANPGTMSHGLTLTAATTIVWYAPTNSNDTYVQANARVRRPGQTRTTVIIHIAGSKIERRMYDRLAKKGKMQGILLDLLEEQEVLTE
jgi:SNF2 family DNA or RNA helicase